MSVPISILNYVAKVPIKNINLRGMHSYEAKFRSFDNCIK